MIEREVRKIESVSEYIEIAIVMTRGKERRETKRENRERNI